MANHVKELGSRLMMDVRAGARIMPIFVYNPKSMVINVEPPPVPPKKEEIVKIEQLRKSHDTSVQSSVQTDKIKEEAKEETDQE